MLSILIVMLKALNLFFYYLSDIVVSAVEPTVFLQFGGQVAEIKVEVTGFNSEDNIIDASLELMVEFDTISGTAIGTCACMIQEKSEMVI